MGSFVPGQLWLGTNVVGVFMPLPLPICHVFLRHPARTIRRAAHTYAAPLPALQSQAVPMPLAVGHTPPAPVLDLGLGMWGLLYLTSSPG
jgi:hypothetical protein